MHEVESKYKVKQVSVYSLYRDWWKEEKQANGKNKDSVFTVVHVWITHSRLKFPDSRAIAHIEVEVPSCEST